MEGDSSLCIEQVKMLFQEASSHVKAISSKLSEDQLLQFYGLYKQAVEGPCSKPKPGFFQLTERQKWQAWSSLKDMDKNEAMTRYIECLNNFDENWKSTSAENTGSWVHHSSMLKMDEEIEDSDKTVFDWVKEGNLKEFESSLGNGIDVNSHDEDGLSLLHWAADRGAIEIVKYLVQNFRADVNVRDKEGQTPLHYASFCGHEEVVTFLLHSNADASIQDNNGESPVDIANSSTIKNLFLAFQKL